MDFFIIFFSSALIIILGALYALLFAFSFLKNKPHYRYIAYLAYGGLVASTTVLASAANLVNHIFWIFVIALMLFGYFFAPRAIWQLCVATHTPDFDSIPKSCIKH